MILPAASFPMTEPTEMKSGSAALLALLCAACQQRPESKARADSGLAASTPAPGDPAYIAEDPRLAQLAGHQDGPLFDAALRKAIAAKGGRPTAATGGLSIAALKPGDLVPAFTLHDSRGRPVEFKAGATAHPRAILFTSVWCESYLQDTDPRSVPKCKRAREDVDRLVKSDKVDWLGIMSHLWTKPADLASYEAETEPQFPTVVDTDGTAFRAFGIRRFPAIALVDREGRLVRVMGPDETDVEGIVVTIGKSQ